MKNYMIGFIVVIMLIFVSGISKVKAEELPINNLAYDRFEFTDEIYQTQINEVVNYLRQYEDTHYIILFSRNDGSFGLKAILKETIDNYTASYNLNINSSTFVSRFNSDTSTSTKPKFLSFNYYNYNNFEDKLNEIKNKFESESYSISQNQSYLFSSSSSFSYDYDTEESTLIPKKLLYYTNVDFKFNSDQFSIKVGDTVIKNEEKLISYYEYIQEYSDSPSAEINISYITNDLGLSEAQIRVNFINYSSLFNYEYSFNGKDYYYIYDIIDNIFEISTYRNGKIYIRIKDIEDNIIFETSKLINMVIDNEDINYYEIDISDFYDIESNKLKYKTFFFENSKLFGDVDIKYHYIDIFLEGDDTNPLPIYITYNNKIMDKKSFLDSLSFEDITCSVLPYEYYNDFIFEPTLKYSTGFVISPCFNLEEHSFDEYTSSKLIIRTNLNLEFSDYIFIEGNIIPTTGNIDEDSNIIMGFINMLLNPILEKMPFISQLSTIYKSLNYDYGNGELPEFKVDLSFLGIDKEFNIIDFRYFLEYRDYIFAFEYLFLGTYTVLGVIKSAQKALE